MKKIVMLVAVAVFATSAFTSVAQDSKSKMEKKEEKKEAPAKKEEKKEKKETHAKKAEGKKEEKQQEGKM